MFALKEKDSDERLKSFFREDPLYLKKYVRERPDNKMAWYLLGREYEAQGKRGKAMYCYEQAGEVYEAFENRKIVIPDDTLNEIREERRRHKRRRLHKALRTAVFGLLAVAAILYAPGLEERDAEEPAAATSGAVPAGEAPPTDIYYLSAGISKESVGSALKEMLLGQRSGRSALLAGGEALEPGNWIGWWKPASPLLSVEPGHDAAERQIRYYDAASCECEPADAAAAQSLLTAWTAAQEQRAVLQSALAAYAQRYGSLPASLEQLSRPYPDNVLPGVTPAMQQLYEQERQALEQTARSWASGAAASRPPSAPAEPSVSGEPLAEPIRLIVDKRQHRLAVVSGNVILRNYPVGLGGEATPEGEFTISEKVRNPNGKSNGEFGSRGMTLSDTQYAIHGTNRPSSIGKDESLGCVRMLKEDIEELFDMVPLGTRVTIGSGLLPSDIGRSPGEPFKLPLFTKETNPDKVYRWLD